MKLKFLIITVLTLIGAPSVQAQQLYVNYDIDTSVFKVGEPLKLWIDFLSTKDDSAGSIYWNKQEVNRFGTDNYFLVENELQFGTDNFLRLVDYANIKVLSIRKIQDYYKITSLFEFKPMNNKGNIQYIFHVYAGIEKNNLKLFNALPINTRLNLSSTTVGFIHFHYPKFHQFDLELAQKQNNTLVDLAKNFEIPLDTIDYYFAPTLAEIQVIKGFDFVVGDNGEQIPSGKADSKNRIVYSSGLGEYYPHEFIHILINPKYPDCHLWINEGIATYFGMSRGKTLDWHLKRVNLHLQSHPEIDLGNMLALRSLDQYTDYRYALGGFIVQKAFEKGGYTLLEKLMKAGNSEEDFYSAIELYLGVKRENLNDWLRAMLKKN